MTWKETLLPYENFQSSQSIKKIPVKRDFLYALPLLVQLLGFSFTFSA